ncbi:hypothetical protein SAMN06295885_0126 [Rathayibacter oskolensis]|uniref:Uncharacterized protein n=1 Tax=Rathayibacter oskolensis TaxID=1891671 RepID=A0A1X7MVB9_9MICO|nr:hypothetical protein [Rathayibacter oskolensis]SMH28278.1 hypothetical protein SAMN06295885_0126 [Rathayibacter oskolensis]
MGGSQSRGAVVAAIVVVGLLAVLYLGRLGVLFVGATEGDVPPASSIGLPAGSEVVRESVECASGGCWSLLAVRPPEGMSPEELSSELGARLPGSFWDPRTISLSSDPQGRLLVVRADYWTRESAP